MHAVFWHSLLVECYIGVFKKAVFLPCSVSTQSQPGGEIESLGRSGTIQFGNSFFSFFKASLQMETFATLRDV